MRTIEGFDALDSALTKLEPGTLIALSKSIGFYFNHGITKNPNFKKSRRDSDSISSSRRVLSINQISPNPGIIPEEDHYFIIPEVKRVYGLEYYGFTNTCPRIVWTDGGYPPTAGINLFETREGKSGKMEFADNVDGIITQMNHFGYDISDFVIRLKELEPSYKSKLSVDRKPRVIICK